MGLFKTQMFLILLMIFSVILGQSDNMSRKDLIRYLTNTSRYDSDIVPGSSKDEATRVTIQVIIYYMSISETDMDYSVDLFLRQTWRDERLDFSHLNTSFEKLEVDQKTMELIWEPDTYFWNEKKAFFHKVTTLNKLMHIHQNGTIIYSTRIAMTLSCDMTFHKYPLDDQLCPFYIQSFGHSVESLDLVWRENNPFIILQSDLNQFDLDGNTSTSRIMISFLTGNFTCLKAEIPLRRKTGFFVLDTFAPGVLLVILSWVSFWVDPNAVPARVTLGVTCVLTMTTQSSGVGHLLPTASYVKAIDVWMFMCLLFVFAALLEFAYVNVLLRSPPTKTNTDEDNVNRTQDSLPGNDARRRSKLGHWWTETYIGSCINCRKDLSPHEKAKQADVISRYVFPSAFTLFLIIFFLVCVYKPDSAIDSHIPGV